MLNVTEHRLAFEAQRGEYWPCPREVCIFSVTHCVVLKCCWTEGKNLSQLTEGITPFRPLLFQTRRSNLPSSTRCIMRTWESSSSTRHRCYIYWGGKHDFLQIAPFNP